MATATRDRIALGVLEENALSLPFEFEESESQLFAGTASVNDRHDETLPALLPSALPEIIKTNRVHYGINIHELMKTVPARPVAVFEEPCFQDATLFVDKYRPKKFIDLLGDERTNRHVMRWLRRWKVDSTPEKKILLLHGTPGCGKTTLAHVGAKQAGYAPVEINASDERNRDVVKNRIVASVGTRSVRRNPAAVILDEIDAADAGFIKALIELLEPKGKHRHKRYVHRPIIAICNDLYANVLRPLRPHAEIVHFRKPAKSSLVTRLAKICATEKIGHELGVLGRVVDLAETDLRACLNLLEGYKHGDRKITKGCLLEQCKRDTSSSSYTILQRVFSSTQPPDASSTDDLEKTITLAFANYLNQDSSSNLRTLDKISDFLYLPEGYNEVKLAAFHHLLSTRHPTVESSSADFEAYTTKTQNETLLNDISPTTPHLYQTFPSCALASELLPFLNRLLAPDIRPASAGVLPEDQKRLQRSADAANAFGIGLLQMRNEDGAQIYRLDPPIERIVVFDAVAYTSAPFVTRQALSRLLQQERRTLHPDPITPQKRKGDETSAGDKDKQRKDFFGRAVAQTSAEKLSIKISTERVWLKYHEGYSNAVRKPISIAELLRGM